MVLTRRAAAATTTTTTTTASTNKATAELEATKTSRPLLGDITNVQPQQEAKSKKAATKKPTAAKATKASKKGEDFSVVVVESQVIEALPAAAALPVAKEEEEAIPTQQAVVQIQQDEHEPDFLDSAKCALRFSMGESNVAATVLMEDDDVCPMEDTNCLEQEPTPIDVQENEEDDEFYIHEKPTSLVEAAPPQLVQEMVEEEEPAMVVSRTHIRFNEDENEIVEIVKIPVVPAATGLVDPMTVSREPEPLCGYLDDDDDEEVNNNDTYADLDGEVESINTNHQKGVLFVNHNLVGAEWQGSHTRFADSESQEQSRTHIRFADSEVDDLSSAMEMNFKL